jgi:hypothetical protein
MRVVDQLSMINGMHYEWNDTMKELTGTEGSEYGVIAQEVQAVFPDAVTTGDDGYLQVDYIQLIPIMIEAIKELKLEIDQLKGG